MDGYDTSSTYYLNGHITWLEQCSSSDYDTSSIHWLNGHVTWQEQCRLSLFYGLPGSHLHSVWRAMTPFQFNDIIATSLEKSTQAQVHFHCFLAPPCTEGCHTSSIQLFHWYPAWQQQYYLRPQFWRFIISTLFGGPSHLFHSLSIVGLMLHESQAAWVCFEGSHPVGP